MPTLQQEVMSVLVRSLSIRVELDFTATVDQLSSLLSFDSHPLPDTSFPLVTHSHSTGMLERPQYAGPRQLRFFNNV